MNKNFTVTDINSVLFVKKDSFKGSRVIFNSDAFSNELIFNLSGKSTVKFNGKTLICEENSIRFLPEGNVWEYVVDREKIGECIDIFFSTNVPISNESFVLKSDNAAELKILFKKIFSVWVAKNEGYRFECMSILYKILAMLEKNNYIAEKQYKIIYPALKYIEENFLNGKISVSYLADICSVSESYMKKLFVKKFGVPPVKYIIQLKMNYARDLLEREEYTVTDIAQICGYDNLGFFSRQFKDYTGITPTKFKEDMQRARSPYATTDKL